MTALSDEIDASSLLPRIQKRVKHKPPRQGKPLDLTRQQKTRLFCAPVPLTTHPGTQRAHGSDPAIGATCCPVRRNGRRRRRTLRRLGQAPGTPDEPLTRKRRLRPPGWQRGRQIPAMESQRPQAQGEGSSHKTTWTGFESLPAMARNERFASQPRDKSIAPLHSCSHAPYNVRSRHARR